MGVPSVESLVLTEAIDEAKMVVRTYKEVLKLDEEIHHGLDPKFLFSSSLTQNNSIDRMI